MKTEPWRPPSLTRGEPTVVISNRQATILAALCCGHSNRMIGRTLGISEETVKTHVKRLLKALQAVNRAHAVALASSGQLSVVVRVNAWDEKVTQMGGEIPPKVRENGGGREVVAQLPGRQEPPIRPEEPAFMSTPLPADSPRRHA